MSELDKETAYKKICSQITLQEKKEGFFLSLAEEISKKIDPNLFAKYTTDYERVKFVAAFCWNSIGAQLIYRGKKEEEAVTRRQEGNAHFGKGEYQKALLCYCQSIIQAPVGSELINVYSNRSALFQKMGEYELSITDAELAISFGAPESNRHKLYERMASCYVVLKNFHKAKVILRLAKHFYEKYDKDNKKFEHKLEKITIAIQSAMEKETKDKIDCILKTNHNDEKPSKFKPGKKFPSASNKFDVQYSSGFGRFAYAKEKICAGEEVLREKPFAACLSPDRMGTHCLHCFTRLKAPIACETCANVAFCSRECKKQGDLYHRYECRVMSLLLGSGMSMNCWLALRIITQCSISEFKRIIPSLSVNPEIIPTTPDGVYDDSYTSIYNLSGLEEQRPAEELIQRSIMALFLVKCLRLLGYFDVNLFKNPFPTPDELHIAALILRNLQVLQFNSYEVCEFLMQDKSSYKNSKTFSLGLAIYPTASYFNHSCAPDVARYFIGTTMVSTAIKGIDEKQPIFDNYGPQFIKADRNDRRFKLGGRYWFHCSCDACVNDWQKLRDITTEIEPKNLDEMTALEELQKIEPTYFDTAMKAMEVGKPDLAIELLTNYIKESEIFLEKHKDASFYPYKTVLLSQQAIQLCLCSLGSVHFA